MTMYKKLIKRIALHLFMFTFVIVALYPVFLMLMDSFKTAQEISANPTWIPKAPTFKNYTDLFAYNGGQIMRTALNTIFVSSSNTLLMLIITSMAAYAFAKFNFKGSKSIFVLLLATMMIPGDMLIPPLYIILSRLGWINSYKSLIIPGIARVMPLFLLRQYMISIPDSMIEAAKLDGAGPFRVYRSIILPSSVAALATVTILEFLNKWNEYLWPLMVMNNPNRQTIMVVLPTLTIDGNLFSIPWTLVLTGCVVATIPIIVIFLIFSDKVMMSMAAGAVKG